MEVSSNNNNEREEKVNFSQDFLEGRRLHLLNKYKETKRRLNTDKNMPMCHRRWKTVAVLPQIEDAIKRLDYGVYGICLDCQEPIPLKRLNRLPEVEYCVSCKTAIEQKKVDIQNVH